MRPHARDGTTADKKLLNRENLDFSDPVHKLLAVLPDADSKSETIIRNITTDEHYLDIARDEVSRSHGKTGLAITILRRLVGGGPASDFTRLGGVPEMSRSSITHPHRVFDDISGKVPPESQGSTWSAATSRIPAGEEFPF